MDTGSGGIYAWVGKGATQQEKKAAYQSALVGYCVSNYLNPMETTIFLHFSGLYCPEGLPNMDQCDMHT